MRASKDNLLLSRENIKASFVKNYKDLASNLQKLDTDMIILRNFFDPRGNLFDKKESAIK